MERKSIPNLAIGSLATTLMLISKTSATLSCAAVILSAILLGRVRGFVIPVVCIAAMSLLAFMIAAFINPDFISETLLAGDTAESFAMEDGEFTSGTSAWRWNWWMMIWDDTMRVAPIWGQGLGADISTPFLGATMGELVRYPHNIIFTVIGRLGLAGLFIFSTLFITIGILAMKFCIRYYNSVDRRDADLICCAIVIAGMVNGVLQSTYEVPHGAITHWVCLGYMVARYYNPVANNNTAQPEALKKM
jgi:O-antigen ligase